MYLSVIISHIPKRTSIYFCKWHTPEKPKKLKNSKKQKEPTPMPTINLTRIKAYLTRAKTYLADLLKTPPSLLANFIASNAIYVACSIIYVIIAALLLGGSFKVWLFCILAYSLSLCIALSPIGEAILRFTENIRPLYTKRETEYLLPLFNEVYDNAKIHNPSLKLEMCVIDHMNINACAIGRHTIAVTNNPPQHALTSFFHNTA